MGQVLTQDAVHLVYSDGEFAERADPDLPVSRERNKIADA